MGRLSIVVLFTPDMARQQEFYEKSLGLSPAAASARWVQFGTRDAVLALRKPTSWRKALPIRPTARGCGRIGGGSTAM